MQEEYLANLPYKSFAELLDYQAQNLPDKICLLYPDLSSDPICYSLATFAQVNTAANSLAVKYDKQINVPRNSLKSTVVGLLANSSTDYLMTMYGLVKLGVVVFPLSIRNSQPALEHLIRATGVSHLIVEPGQTHVEIDGLKIISLEKVDWNTNDVLPHLVCEKDEAPLERLQFIFHSSGSTSFPKPIQYTNRSILMLPLVALEINERFWNENDTVLTLGALFHMLPFATIISCLSAGGAYALPLVRNYPPTPKQLIANLREKRINKLVSVPLFLEQLDNELESDPSADYTVLSRLEFIFYGGASMSDHICRKLIDHGVHLVCGYGTTETGMMMFKDLKSPITRWKWMKICHLRRPYIQIRPDDHVLVHMANDPFVQKGVANQADGSYSTNDVLIEDPPGSGEYTIEGRQDDTLVHVNGEKTNPIPMESTICLSPFVQRALVFGQQRLCTGVLIQLNTEEANKYSLDDILEKVWDAVEAANKSAPSHSRIVRPMVKCIPLNKVLPITEKGNLTRKRANNEYATVIDDLYEKFLQPKQDNDSKPRVKEEWNRVSLCNYLQKMSSKLSAKAYQDFTDTSKSIFDLGFDSLHAVQLRNELCSIFPSVPMNFIYEFSSIDSMVNELLAKDEKINVIDDPQHHKLTETLIDKYINKMKRDLFPTNTTEKKKDKRNFLVTGANGSLGSWMVLDLLQDESVNKVFCLFRGQNKHRIIKEFEQRQQPTDIFNDDNDRLVLLPNMKLSEGLLGLDADTYNQLSNEVTDVIHSAYRMDFNLTVRDFEKDGILGTYHLLKLARKSNARFHFISSVASSGSGTIPEVKEEPLARRPELPVAQGYGQSKYICEHLGAAAKRIWRTPVDIYRVGQISGDSEHGAWNTSEMVSLIICIGGGELQQMPSEGQDIRWIPVDTAASSIVDIALQNYLADDHIHHIVNPHAIKWTTFLQYLRTAGLHFQTVNPAEWLEIVLASQTALVKLSSFFETFFTSKAGFRIAEYETIKTEKRSEHLHSCPAVNVKLIRNYLSFWYNTGFLTNGYQ